jgi:hypothetical protein
LTTEIEGLARKFGVERLGFLSLTFKPGKAQWDMKEAKRRFHSLMTNILNARYEAGIAVWERSPVGRLHCHLFVVLASDIRTGFDFKAVDNRDYRSVSKFLDAEWRFWRKTAPRYGFGRHQLYPVESNGAGIARYIGKYIGKDVNNRLAQDRGERRISYFGFGKIGRSANTSFSWATPRGRLWLQKKGAFMKSLHLAEMEQLTELFGPRWCYTLLPFILAMPVVASSEEEALAESESRHIAALVMENALKERKNERPPGRLVRPYSLKSI